IRPSGRILQRLLANGTKGCAALHPWLPSVAAPRLKTGACLGAPEGRETVARGAASAASKPLATVTPPARQITYLPPSALFPSSANAGSTGTGGPSSTFNVASTGTAFGGKQLFSSHTWILNVASFTTAGPAAVFGDTTALRLNVTFPSYSRISVTPTS